MAAACYMINVLTDPRSFPVTSARHSDMQHTRTPGAGELSMTLILRAQQGDAAAREELFQRYSKRLQGWAHGRLPAYARGETDTMDLVQDTLLQVFTRLDKFEPRHAGAFLGYVRTALHNKVLDRIRRARVRPAADLLDSSQVSQEPSPHAELVGTELYERYESALDQLRERDRTAIVLRIELQLSWLEIVEAMDMPSVPAAQMAVRRALERLAREMAHERKR